MALNGEGEELDRLARQMEMYANEPPPPTTRGVLQKLFDGQSMLYTMQGKVMAELSTLHRAVHALNTHRREVRKHLDSIDDDLEDTKSHEIKTLRSNARWLKRAILGAVIVGVVAFVFEKVLGHA